MTESGCSHWPRVLEVLRGSVRGDDAVWLRQHLGECAGCTHAVRIGLEALPAANGKVQSRTELEIELRQSQNGAIPEGGWLSDFIDAAEADSVDPETDASRPLPSFVKPPLAPGEIGRFATYPVFAILATDPHGAVLLAEDAVQRRVTLHVLHPDLAANERARRRFLRQAQVMAAVAHDHIVPIYHVGEADGLPFLVMPNLEGESLHDRLVREKTIAGTELLRIARQIAAGLAAAHQHGLIHRDLRPECIWLEAPQLRVRILDFGLFRPVAVKADLSSPDAVPGSLSYLSPEQANGQPADERSDLFSFGCILYNAATGRPPFKGGSLLSLLMSLQLETPDPVMPLRPDLPEGFNEIILRLMAKEPEKRPASAAKVEAELARIADRAAGLNHSNGTTAALQSKPKTNKAPVSPRPGEGEPSRVRFWSATGVALLSMLALALFSLYSVRGLWRPQSPPAPRTVTVGGANADFHSLKAALAAVAPGGTVHIFPGSYAEVLRIDKAVTLRSAGASGEVQIRSAGDAAIEVTAANVKLENLVLHGDDNNALRVKSGSAQLSHCKVSNASAGAAVVYVAGTDSRLDMRDCTIADGRNAGLVVEERATVELTDCEISGNALAGVEARLQAKVRLERCRVHHNRSTGLILTSFCEADLHDCEIHANGYTGAEVSREALAVFRRCRIHDHGGSCGLYFYHQGRGELHDCDIFLNHTSGIEVTALSRVKLHGCGIHCNRRHAIDVYRRGEVHYSNCNFDDNTLNAIHAEPDCIVREEK